MIDLVSHIEAGWRPFRAAVDAHRAALERRTSSGWRFRDLVAHVAGWEGDVARRLAVYRIDGVQLEPHLGADELNAEHVARYGRMSTALLLEELDRTHELLVLEVRKLSKAQLRRNSAWAEGIVATNTFRHYADHHRTDRRFRHLPW